MTEVLYEKSYKGLVHFRVVDAPRCDDPHCEACTDGGFAVRLIFAAREGTDSWLAVGGDSTGSVWDDEMFDALCEEHEGWFMARMAMLIGAPWRLLDRGSHLSDVASRQMACQADLPPAVLALIRCLDDDWVPVLRERMQTLAEQERRAHERYAAARFN
jgi:hypothetical protein